MYFFFCSFSFFNEDVFESFVYLYHDWLVVLAHFSEEETRQVICQNEVFISVSEE